MNETLKSGLETLGCPEIYEKLLEYFHEIKLWNTRYGLVNFSEDRELIVKHFLDCLAPLEPFKKWGSLRFADIGSGAGLPGIPLSLALPECRFTLVEKQAKRVRFLENTQLMVGLPNVEILNVNFESLESSYDLVTFRAFTPLDTEVVLKLLKLVAPGGRIAAYKARKQSIDLELKALESLNLPLEVIPLKVPFLDDERHLVVIHKV
ncbi:MAG: 16S rRNA (guanine(527)-N(7))-methyltransferase RsmG [Spirochaetes bacterium GWB1_48_6]|nr:MAG: 16S rRNA (guanine(527)-N(7))-methyltransferase RsmG [Spirochaetes bacterium GWB1_48_6]